VTPPRGVKLLGARADGRKLRAKRRLQLRSARRVVVRMRGRLRNKPLVLETRDTLRRTVRQRVRP
jgi:hypothetical protein